jgi:hypothetical protein
LEKETNNKRKTKSGENVERKGKETTRERKDTLTSLADVFPAMLVTYNPGAVQSANSTL